ncbi:MOSC domain-containing protein [Paenibacillus sp. N1-5-1-14]|uniref:MOSC domain-containing protein n=1 Tax=Paenibacillus radicibacter TaxID=2972488 RepID=UPI0021593239|nr:MOSC domain-containing protein [Paenibacillus radicibacter]MCR8644510.1 MOSC domain-containing protein [Paenibacillus radicibacter]
MTKRSIGTITQLTRYPVKSMAGQAITQTHVAKYGFYGDRSHAFIDPAKEGWNAYITARRYPQMLGYQVELTEPSDGGVASVHFPKIKIVSRTGQEFSWNEAFLQEMQQYVKQPITMKQHQADSQELLAVDAGGILIISDRTLRKLEEIVGVKVDTRRFRANLLVKLDDAEQEDETNWIGRQLSIGNCRLEVTLPCERCVLITIDPDTFERNPLILKKVNEELGLKFGVYANVIEEGQIQLGDEINLH